MAGSAHVVRRAREKMSDWKARGQKRASSSQSTVVAGKRKRSRTMMSSEEEEEEWSEGDEELMMSQIQTQDMDEVGEEKPVFTGQKVAEAGVIDRIQLNDFMCHRKLDVALSPNTNFILGRNGSGKSAIMTAIVVALGGKATTTHRASSLKNFIRTGAKSAEVILTMRNRGLDSYKPDEYGDSMTVHRTIKTDGTTSYKIKAANGSTVSTKREDLVHILDHWNIQVDNPVSLLDQDTSRHFLHSNNPAHKYKLFVKATRLEQIQNDYERAQEDQALMKKSIERNEILSEDLKKEAKLLEERLHLFDRLKEMEDKVRKLEMELQWVMVMELEKNVGPLEEHLAKEKSRLPRNQHTITKAEVCGLHHPIQSCKMAKLLGGLKGGVSSQNNVHFVHDKESLVRSVTYVKQPLTYVW
jgi:recombinational DNA repair ATPase RecF